MEKENQYPTFLIKNIGIAKKLKKIGFDTPCNFFLPLKMYGDFDTKELDFNFKAENYNNSYDYLSIPTYLEVFQWFRSKGYESMIDFYCVIELIVKTGYKYRIFSMKKLKLIENDFFIETYEKAMEELIDKLIKIYESENEQEIQKLNM